MFAGGLGAVQVGKLRSLCGKRRRVDVVAGSSVPLLVLPYDFLQTAELIERAATRTDVWIAEGGLERREIPYEMNALKHN